MRWEIQLLNTNSLGAKSEKIKQFIRPVLTEWEGKGKAVPLQARSGPEPSRNLMFPDFVTTAQDGGKFVSLKYRPPLPPMHYSRYSFLFET